jgi:hypothetical protein
MVRGWIGQLRDSGFGGLEADVARKGADLVPEPPPS